MKEATESQCGVSGRDERNSQISHFYKFSVPERLRVLLERGLLSDADYHQLMDGLQLLTVDAANSMVENVIGVFGLRLGLGLNLQVNERSYVVPMVVEEPSIIAAISSAAKLCLIHI